MQLGEKGRRFSRHDLVFDLQTVRAFRQKGKIFISPPPSISHCNWYCLRETNANTFERRKTRKQIESPGLLPRSERSSKELDLVSTSTSAIIKSFSSTRSVFILNEKKKIPQRKENFAYFNFVHSKFYNRYCRKKKYYCLRISSSRDHNLKILFQRMERIYFLWNDI